MLQLKSPTFWFAAVFVGFLVSVLGNIVFRILNSWWEKESIKGRERKKKRDERDYKIALAISKNVSFQLEFYSLLNRVYTLLTSYMVGFIFCYSVEAIISILKEPFNQNLIPVRIANTIIGLTFLVLMLATHRIIDGRIRIKRHLIGIIKNQNDKVNPK